MGRITKGDIEHLSWIWERLANIHGEKSNVDYMLRLNGIILKIKDDYAYDEMKEIAAMEKQPTEYEYVKVEFDEIAKYIQPLNCGIYQKLSDGSYSELSQIADLYTYRHELYRRITLTPEQLHERKVEELSKLLTETSDNYSREVIPSSWTQSDNEAVMKLIALKALEWMESKGK